jgi:hypothetical protein
MSFIFYRINDNRVLAGGFLILCAAPLLTSKEHSTGWQCPDGKSRSSTQSAQRKSAELAAWDAVGDTVWGRLQPADVSAGYPVSPIPSLRTRLRAFGSRRHPCCQFPKPGTAEDISGTDVSIVLR